MTEIKVKCGDFSAEVRTDQDITLVSGLEIITKKLGELYTDFLDKYVGFLEDTQFIER